MNMSFALTKAAYIAGEKDVTRRLGWNNLHVDDIVMGVNKAQYFQKGERMIRFHPIQIVSVRKEPLNAITQKDVVREGFPGMTVEEFIEGFCKAMKCTPDTLVNRIEFKHIGCQNWFNFHCMGNDRKCNDYFDDFCPFYKAW